MIFGIYGPHAIGKTTFIRSLTAISGVVRVVGDGCGIFDNPYKDLLDLGGKEYTTDLDKKVLLLNRAIADRDRLWVLEGCRFWDGMLQRVRGMIDHNSGGAFILLITTTPKILEQELRRRAAKSGKKFRADYWDAAKLVYESSTRRINSVHKNLHPSEYHRITFKGDFAIWDGVPYDLLTTFYNERDLWYVDSNQR